MNQSLFSVLFGTKRSNRDSFYSYLLQNFLSSDSDFLAQSISPVIHLAQVFAFQTGGGTQE